MMKIEDILGEDKLSVDPGKGARLLESLDEEVVLQLASATINRQVQEYLFNLTDMEFKANNIHENSSRIEFFLKFYPTYAESLQDMGIDISGYNERFNRIKEKFERYARAN